MTDNPLQSPQAGGGRCPALSEELVEQAWRSLIEKDDRTSPEEYPDMALIKFDELREIIADFITLASWWNRRASTPAPSGLAGEAVAKPLEWYSPSNGCDTLVKVETPFGIYRVYTYYEANGRWFWSLDGYEKKSGEAVSEAEAKAAAQADFETRIRSALAVPPSIPAGGVREGWKLVPSEATPEMLGAWYRYKNGHRWPDEEPARDTSDVGAYRAMLAAAPAPASLSLPAEGVAVSDAIVERGANAIRKLWQENPTGPMTPMAMSRAALEAAITKTAAPLGVETQEEVLGLPDAAGNDEMALAALPIPAPDAQENAGLVAARQIASEQCASVTNVRIPDGGPLVTLTPAPDAQAVAVKVKPLNWACASSEPIGWKPSVKRKPWPEPGDKLVYLDENGYDFEREEAAKIMRKGDVFTLKNIEIRSFSNSLEFVEIPGKRFNGVMFDFASPQGSSDNG